VAKKFLIKLTEEVHRQLQRLVDNSKLDSRNAQRARVLIMAHAGVAAADIARKVGVSVSTVRRLCKTFLERGPTAVVTGLVPAETEVGPPHTKIEPEAPRVGPVGGTAIAGEVPPDGEYRLRSPDWPVGAQVLWSVVPTGGPAGAPALTWQVSVAQSQPGYVTYWITVKNLTPVAIPFEGRASAVEAVDDISRLGPS
jgi:hypothetical protein